MYVLACERILYGDKQRERILRALGRTTTGHNYALESLQHIPARFFPSGSQIIYVGPLSGKDDVAVLTRLRANGYAVLVIGLDPIDYEVRMAPEDNPPNPLAIRLSRAMRHSVTATSSSARCRTSSISASICA